MESFITHIVALKELVVTSWHWLTDSLALLTPAQITDGWIFVLIVIFLFFLIVYGGFLLKNTWLLWQTIKQIEKLGVGNNISNNVFDNFIKNLKGKQQESFKQFYVILKDVNGRLYATEDVESTARAIWSPSLLRSHLFPVGATLLTGIGVLGTFYGLLIGLGGLQLDGNMDELQQTIGQVANGAAVAFETSVCGVALSFLLTLIEKFFYSLIEKQYDKLQSLLCRTFPPFKIMYTFADIKENTEKSADTLDKLADQIGIRMQNSLDAFSQKMMQDLGVSIARASDQLANAVGQRITDSFGTSINEMTEAIKAMAERQAMGAEGTLKTLLEEFLAKMGEAGNGQRQAMETATQNMLEGMDEFRNSMNALTHQIQKEQEAARQEADRVKAEWIEQIKDSFTKQAAVLEKLGQTVGEHVSSTRTILEQGNALQGHLEQNKNDMQKLASAMAQSSHSLEQASGQLNAFTGNIKESVEKNARSTESAANSIRNVNAMQEALAAHLQQILGEVEGLGGKMGETASSLASSLSTARVSFEVLSSHYQELQDTLEEHIQELEDQTNQRITKLDEHMAELLEQYSDIVNAQVSNRMVKWDEQTKNFCDAMENTVRIIQELVDDLLDSKTQN